MVARLRNASRITSETIQLIANPITTMTVVLCGWSSQIATVHTPDVFQASPTRNDDSVNSPNETEKTSSAPAMIPGPMFGRITRRNVCQRDAPSVDEASLSTAVSMARSALSSARYMNGSPVTTYARTSSCGVPDSTSGFCEYVRMRDSASTMVGRAKGRRHRNSTTGRILGAATWSKKMVGVISTTLTTIVAIEAMSERPIV